MKVDFVNSLDRTSKIVGHIASITFCVAVILKSGRVIHTVVRSSVKSALSSVKSIAVSLKKSKPVETTRDDTPTTESNTDHSSKCESSPCDAKPSEENKDGSDDDMLK